MQGGDNKLDIKIMLMTIIALTALLGGQGFIMNLLLEPVKQSQARMEKQMGKVESRMDTMESRMESRMDTLESKVTKLESKVDKLESKVDRVLLQKNLVPN